MADKPRHYKHILESSPIYRFLPASEAVIAEYTHVDAVFRDTTALVTAPSLTAYVAWILSDAVSKNIKTLFFLARDGLVLWNIAQSLCRIWNINIECKYLYCSRLSLRLPLYAIDRGYALEKLCAATYNISLNDILQRVNITKQQNNEVASDLGISLSEPLNKEQLSGIKRQLEKSGVFNTLAEKNSKIALVNVTGYLKQEFSGVSSFAFVDTGWLGSMQSCLSILLKHAVGIPQSSAVGYYLGLFRSGNPLYGYYNCFLFNNAKEMPKLNGFNNNLIECLCAADHGMTVGYHLIDRVWLPDLRKPEQVKCRSAWDACTQIKICISYAERFAKNNVFKKITDCKRKLVSTINRLLLGLMSRPSLAEAELFGAIPFSDGMDTNTVTTLAMKMTFEQIKYKSLSYRVFDLLTGRNVNKPPARPIYWINGALALSGLGLLKVLDIKVLDSLYWVLYR